ncbi:hypothetical protein, partial [Pseudonocardia nigra]|uniref:hypothetical protein n=1 Tax=Pseudonocardia nigra TaxID=1921578 RepID=UPI001C5D13C7
MDPAVIDGLDPGGEQSVELAQIGDLVPAGLDVGIAGDLPGDFHEELLADGAGGVGRAARCPQERVLFRAASRRTGRDGFPVIRLS